MQLACEQADRDCCCRDRNSAELDGDNQETCPRSCSTPPHEITVHLTWEVCSLVSPVVKPL